MKTTPEEERNFKKVSASLFTWNLTLGQFSVSACANQPTGFSVNGSSTPDGLFQTINALKQLMDYSKRLHQLSYGVLFHLKIENLELFVNY